MKISHAALAIAMFAPLGLSAEDLFYLKGQALYVIHDVEQGKSGSSKLDTPVARYVAEGGAVLYLKGHSLHLIRDTRDPKPELLDVGVSDIGFRDGLIVYVRRSHLLVRRLADDSNASGRIVMESQGVSQFDVRGGTVVFLKNGSTLYRVTSLDRGTADRVVYPVSDIQVSGSKER